MDYLVLAPPVCTPAEPPSGAFLLAAGLKGRGYDVGLLDLSLELFHQFIGEQSVAVKNAARYLFIELPPC